MFSLITDADEGANAFNTDTNASAHIKANAYSDYDARDIA